jgi:Flp pilus assembly protein TadG
VAIIGIGHFPVDPGIEMKSLHALSNFIRRFARVTSGTAAIEFSLVALPFFSLMFAIIDSSLIYFSTATLESGVSAAARLIRTGQAQNSALTQAQFRQLVCNNISPLLGCDARLMLDVRKYVSFGTIASPPALDANGNFTNNTSFQMGAAGDVVVVRAYYQWPLFSPAASLFANMSGNNRLVYASTAFKNEPF